MLEFTDKPPFGVVRAMHVPTDREMLWLEHMSGDILCMELVGDEETGSYGDAWDPARGAPLSCDKRRRDHPTERIGWVEVRGRKGGGTLPDGSRKYHAPWRVLLPLLYCDLGDGHGALSLGYFDEFWRSPEDMGPLIPEVPPGLPPWTPEQCMAAADWLCSQDHMTPSMLAAAGLREDCSNPCGMLESYDWQD